MSGRRRNVNIGANSIVYSGRGRPRTKESVDRPLPVGIVLGTPSPGSDIYRNRKIRVGGAFQVKVPKKPLIVSEEDGAGGEVISSTAYQSSRPAPMRVSTSNPHLTQEEVTEYEDQKQQLQQEKQGISMKQSSETKDPTAMEMDTHLSQEVMKDPDDGTTTPTTISPDSSNSLLFNGSPKRATDRQQEQQQQNSSSDTKSTNSNDNLSEYAADKGKNNDESQRDDCLETRRGGLLLYSSSAAANDTDTSTSNNQNNEDFWDFVQPLLVAPPSKLINTDESNQTSWQWHIHQWYVDQEREQQLAEQQQREELEQQQLLQEQLPRRRGRRKRKKETTTSSPEPADQENILDWYAEQRARKRPRSQVPAEQEEDRAHAMQQLWLRHKGQGAIAKIETMVQFSTGKAEMTRKVRQHKRRKASPKNTTGALSWREYCKQSTLKSMTGDFRGTNAEANSAIAKSEAIDPNQIELHREVWKSVLKLGQAIEESLNKAAAAPGTKKYVQLLKLSSATSFLNNAYQVRPLPEEIFLRVSDVIPAINTCFDNIAQYVDQARKVQAELMDLLYETNNDGVDLDALNKLLDQSRRSLAMELDDAKVLYEQVELGLAWQKRLDAMVAESDLCLTSLEELAEEGRCFAFRTKSLACLENRIHKAYHLRDKIVDWRKACTQCLENDDDLDDKKECVKFLHAMVREANRLKLSFPEVSELRETHRSVEAWIDRANIAIRSRISLTEIKALIERGQNMPVDLADSMEKLRARENLAEEWIHHFEEVVPRPNPLPTDTGTESEEMLLRWMRGMRHALSNGKYAALHDIASEGSRIPVEVDLVKLLQLELDSKNWTSKAKKWVPSLSEESTTCKKAKLEDLREHLGKATVLRERLDLSASAKEAWTLDGEAEIRSIVQAADDWFVKYKPYLDWDNRRSLGRSCLSLSKLKTIVDEGNSIQANIGNGIGKMTRILAQADGWVKAHEPLLLTCKIIPQDGSSVQPLDKRLVTLEAMTEVAEVAASDVSLDLDEAKELLKLVGTVKDWSSRVANAAPKRSVRGRGRKPKFTVDDIISLINESENIPVDVTADINRLQIQLSAVQEWRAKAREKLEEIANGFLKLRHVVDEMYGAPNEYSRKNDKTDASDESKSVAKSEMDTGEEKKTTEDLPASETASNAGSEQDLEGIPNFGNGVCNVNQRIKVYRREAKAFGVVSGEVEAAEQLDKLSNWCVKSLKYLVNQRDVFDKRYFSSFERFVAEGRELLNPQKSDAKIKVEDEAFSERLNAAWVSFVSDQIQRLDVLVADREQFMAWCSSAEEELFSNSKDNRPSLEKLRHVSDRSRAFPAVCDMVQKVRGLFNKAMEWKDSTRKLLNGDEKLSPLEAKNILEVGERLGFSCEEMKVLRNALKAARNWSNRVKRCDIEQGSTNATAVQTLIDDHDALVLEMPEEVSRLKQAMQSYCLCRRPYSGFMIGCDECEEWYHGNCIGITESKADRVDKYVCIRCSLSRVFKNTAKDAVGIVKKWSCPKDMKKARQVEAQKHQRKVRKETKEIEKLRAQIQALEASQAEQERVATEAANGIPSQEVATAKQEVLAVPETATIPAMDQDTQKSDEKDAEQPPSVPKLSPEEGRAKIDKAQETIRQCGDRLARLSEKGEERKAILCVEDSKAPLLKNWCLRVRSIVLVPRTDEAVEASRPLEDGSLSPSMQSLIDEAKEAGIGSVADVKAMINAFRCMSWCLRATRILARKPTMAEMEMLVTHAKRLKLTEEKALRMMKAIVLRAKSWQGKVLKALSPSPESKAFNVESLKELQVSSEEIPLLQKEEVLLSGVIEDMGARHCLCGGPTDARVMLSCDKCEKWFHGPCVNMTKQQCHAVGKWICPHCTGSSCSPVDVTKCGIVWEDRDDPRQAKKRLVASEAPDPVKMWPPFGLFASDKAREVLGGDCSAMPDVASTKAQSEPIPAVSLQPSERANPQPEMTNGPSDAMMMVPPTTLVQSADVSQELHMPLSQGLQPANCALLGDGDTDAQAQFAASTLKTSLELSQQQAFHWFAQSGAAAIAATQANLAQSQPHGFGLQYNPFLSVAATAAAAASASASLSSQAAMEDPNSNNNSESHADATQDEKPLSALETLAQMANNPQILEMSHSAGAQVAGDTLKTEAESVEAAASAPAEDASKKEGSTVQNSCTAEQCLSAAPSAAASAAAAVLSASKKDDSKAQNRCTAEQCLSAAPSAAAFAAAAVLSASKKDDSTVQNSCTTEQFSSAASSAAASATVAVLSAAPSAASAATAVSSEPQLPSPSPQLNPTALNLIVAALPVQESGS